MCHNDLPEKELHVVERYCTVTEEGPAADFFEVVVGNEPTGEEPPEVAAISAADEEDERFTTSLLDGIQACVRSRGKKTCLQSTR